MSISLFGGNYETVLLDLEGVLFDTETSDISAEIKKCIAILRLKGVHIYIATGASIDEIKKIDQDVNLFSLIPQDHIYSCVSLGYQKSDRQFFESILFQTHSRHKTTLHIDDGINGIMGACKSGITTVFIGKDISDADYSFSNLLEFYNFFYPLCEQ